MSKQVVRYKCDYCNKELKTEKGIQHHEKGRCSIARALKCELRIEFRPYEMFTQEQKGE